MKKTNKIILASVILAMLLLGIGYAAIQNITLNINGTAAADPSQANFKVMFSGTPTVSHEEHVSASITNDTNATINVFGLTKKGEKVTASYIVQNTSPDLSADLSVATTNSNVEFFTLTAQVEKTSLIAGEATKLVVTVEVTKTPITDSEIATVGVQLEAMPVQPGEEGISEGINDFSQTPVSTIGNITNDNIGDYIDLGNNLVGTESTSDDWRILYKEGNVVYVILADYLPNSTKYAEAAGLLGTEKYSVSLNTNRENFLEILTNNTNWNAIANGLSGAEVIATPSGDLLINSYNIKNGTNLQYTNLPNIKTETEDNDLYLPHTETFENCSGYWLASKSKIDENGVWVIDFTGSIHCFMNSLPGFALRPVISLPTDLICNYVNGVWKIT